MTNNYMEDPRANSVRPQNESALIDRVLEAASANMWDETISYARTGIALHIDDARLYAALALAYMMTNQQQKAISTCIDGLFKYPDTSDLYNIAAKTYVDLKMFDKAEYYVNKGLILDPYNSYLLQLQVVCLIRTYRCQEAETAIKEYTTWFEMDTEFAKLIAEHYLENAVAQVKVINDDEFFPSKAAYDTYLSMIKSAKRYCPDNDILNRLYLYAKKLGQKGVLSWSVRKIYKKTLWILLLLGIILSSKSILVRICCYLAAVVVFAVNISRIKKINFPLWAHFAIMQTGKIPDGIGVTGQDTSILRLYPIEDLVPPSMIKQVINHFNPFAGMLRKWDYIDEAIGGLGGLRTWRLKAIFGITIFYDKDLEKIDKIIPYNN